MFTRHLCELYLYVIKFYPLWRWRFILTRSITIILDLQHVSPHVICCNSAAGRCNSNVKSPTQVCSRKEGRPLQSLQM